MFDLISSFLSNRWLRFVLDGKPLQEYSVNAGVPQDSILHFLMILSIIMPSTLMILLSTLSLIRHLICGKKKSWLVNLNLIYETLWTWLRSGLLISMLEKFQLILFHGSNSTGTIAVKWMGLFFRKNHFLRCYGSLFLLNWIGTLISSLLLKLPPRKLER